MSTKPSGTGSGCDPWGGRHPGCHRGPPVGGLELVVDGSEDARELGIALEAVEFRNGPAVTSLSGARGGPASFPGRVPSADLPAGR